MDIKSDQNMEAAILEAAERLFLEKGFALTSTTQIAKAVGCNQALVHYYFRTKDNLFNTIFEHKFKIFFQQIFNFEQLDKLNFSDKIKFIVESHFDMLHANANLTILIFTEFSRRPDQLLILKEKLQNLPQQFFEKLNQDLEAEIEAGRIRPILLLDLIITVMSLNVSLFVFMPIIKNLITVNDEQFEYLTNRRKIENVTVILNSLRP